MTYAEQVVKLASEIAVEAERLAKLEKSRSEWVTPLREWVTIGDSRHYVVGKDGKVAAGLEGMQREALKIHDSQIALSKSRIEGIRFRLVQVAKQDAAA